MCWIGAPVERRHASPVGETMQGRIARSVMLSVSALTVVLLSSGCSYLTHRAQDFAEIVDIGFTASLKPGFALYGDGVSVLPLGISYVDGYFLGWGGGRIGVTRHHEKCWGSPSSTLPATTASR